MAQTFTATSPSFAHVNAAVLQARDGDTVVIPANGAGVPFVAWASTDVLNINFDMQIIGAGIDATHATPNPAVCTIIRCTNSTGAMFSATYNGTELVSRISGIIIEVTTVGGKYLFNIFGKAYRRRNNTGAVVGGLRLDNLRIRSPLDSSGNNFAIGKGALLFDLCSAGNKGAGYFISGSIDHNYFDYAIGTTGNEVNSFCSTGSKPPDTYANGHGQYQWEQTYIFGAAGGDDSELDALYIEDNIIHKGGHAFGTLQGGARIVFRHNTTWGYIEGHGIDGNNNGPASWEIYNNYYDTTRHPNFGGRCTETRGGAMVCFNNRYTTTAPDIAIASYRPHGAHSAMMGPATGRNFFDWNETGTINVNGRSFAPKRGVGKDETDDPRLGSIYASGTCQSVSGRNYTLTGLDGTFGGTVSTGDKWVGFILVNATTGGDGLTGSHPGDQGVPIQGIYGIITANTAANTSVVTVPTAANPGQNFTMSANQSFEVRRIKQYFCQAGAGKLLQHSNGGHNGDNLPNTGDPNTSGYCFLTPANGKVKYWAGQYAFGIWQKGNRTRTDRTKAWNGATGISSPTITDQPNAAYMVGPVRDEELPTFASNAAATGGSYPQIVSPSAAYLRIGADWVAEGYASETIESSAGAAGGALTVAYGARYPNDMVTGAVISGSAPTVTSEAANGTTGVAFSYQILGTNTPTSYSSGTLPTGFSLDTSTGIISCTALNNTNVINTNVAIHALNAFGTGNGTLTIVITSSAVAPVINSSLTASGTVGDVFSYTITALNSPTSFNATSRPPGFTIDTSTGVLACTSAANVGPAATYSVTISATNGTGTDSETLVVTLASAPPPPGLAPATIVVTA